MPDSREIEQFCDPDAINALIKHWGKNVQIKGAGEPLAWLLRRRGISTSRLALAVQGVSRERLDDVVRVGRAPSLSEARGIADFLGVEVTDLWPENFLFRDFKSRAEKFVATDLVPEGDFYYAPSKIAAASLADFIKEAGLPVHCLESVCQPAVYLRNWRFQHSRPSSDHMRVAMFVLSVLTDSPVKPQDFGFTKELQGVG